MTQKMALSVILTCMLACGSGCCGGPCGNGFGGGFGGLSGLCCGDYVDDCGCDSCETDCEASSCDCETCDCGVGSSCTDCGCGSLCGQGCGCGLHEIFSKIFSCSNSSCDGCDDTHWSDWHGDTSSCCDSCDTGFTSDACCCGGGLWKSLLPFSLLQCGGFGHCGGCFGCGNNYGVLSNGTTIETFESIDDEPTDAEPLPSPAEEGASGNGNSAFKRRWHRYPSTAVRPAPRTRVKHIQ